MPGGGCWSCCGGGGGGWVVVVGGDLRLRERVVAAGAAGCAGA